MGRHRHLNGLTLAYIGDAVYELRVRDHLIQSGQVKPNELHQRAVSYVSAKSQAEVIWEWLETNLLTEEEERVVARGRNAKSRSIPRNTNVHAYRYSTGFEALIGYHYLEENEKRLNELLQQALLTVEKRSRENG